MNSWCNIIYNDVQSEMRPLQPVWKLKSIFGTITANLELLCITGTTIERFFLYQYGDGCKYPSSPAICPLDYIIKCNSKLNSAFLVYLNMTI